MSNIMISSEDNKKHKLLKSEEELVTALCNNEFEFIPVIKNKKFSNTVFEIPLGDREDEDYWNNIPRIKAIFEDCEFSNIEFVAHTEITLNNCVVNGMNCLGESNSFKVKDSVINNLSMQFADARIEGENTKFKELGLNEGDAHFSTKNCNFDENIIHKTQIGGNIEGGTFSISGRTYLGQYQDLTMKNVNFGSEKVDEFYFHEGNHHDNLELINCENAGETLNKKKEEKLVVGVKNTQSSYNKVDGLKR